MFTNFIPQFKQKLIAVNDNVFVNILTLLFACFGIIGIFHHELWFDELQAWLIARDSNSLVDLFQNIRYEGHPGLWHLCLYFLNKITDRPLIMQFFHLGIATLSIYLLVKFSPFTRLQKFLFSFGYFPFYEYSLLSRNYALGILLCFIFCVYFQQRNRKYVLLFFILALAANTNVHSLLIAVWLGATLIFEYFLKQKLSLESPTAKKKLLIGIVVFSLGIILAISQLVPPEDRPVNTLFRPENQQELVAPEISVENSSDELKVIQEESKRDVSEFAIVILKRISTMFDFLTRSYIFLPNFLDYNFWNSSILLLVLPPWKLIIDFLSLGLILFVLSWLYNKPTILFLYFFGSLTILLLTIKIGIATNPRHYGHLFILFILCLWLANSAYKFDWLAKIFPGKTIHLSRGLENRKYKNFFLSLILSIHLFAGLLSYSLDLVYPFTVSKQVANFLQQDRFDNFLIVGNPDFPVSSLAAYLEQPIYHPESNRFGSFIIWNDRRNEIDEFQLWEKVSNLKQETARKILLVSTQDFSQSSPEVELVKLKQFGRSIVIYEEYYYVYRVE
ncbi:MAG: hypothetical protein F6K45_24900 [Kamptonema sp. SIO1D9]|nr:hypothetical protein [Kamptonema sp. SIO1D9]